MRLTQNSKIEQFPTKTHQFSGQKHLNTWESWSCISTYKSLLFHSKWRLCLESLIIWWKLEHKIFNKARRTQYSNWTDEIFTHIRLCFGYTIDLVLLGSANFWYPQIIPLVHSLWRFWPSILFGSCFVWEFFISQYLCCRYDCWEHMFHILSMNESLLLAHSLGYDIFFL